jgi:hypothetical protein
VGGRKTTKIVVSTTRIKNAIKYLGSSKWLPHEQVPAPLDNELLYSCGLSARRVSGRNSIYVKI